MAAPALRVEDLTVQYGSTLALDHVSLDAAPGEMVALLGPSGSGKTTLLHATAGFLTPAGGSIWIDQVCVSGPGAHVPPEKRGIGLVFQSYALWPHLSVLDTVAYPLRRRGLGRQDAAVRARELLVRLELQDFADRRPGQLSGGQQQRVGLARALATQPRLFLFDEPTANLDAALKAAFQAEIRRQQARTGAAALYVTHDPGEAFGVADRVAVLRHGRLVQVGSPIEVYRQPADSWVAGLTGPGTVLEARVQRADPATYRAVLLLAGTQVSASYSAAPGPRPVDGSTVRVLLRPEWLRLEPGADQGLPARVAAVRFQGPHTDYELESPAGALTLRAPGPPRAEPGAEVHCAVDHVCFLPADQPTRAEPLADRAVSHVA